MWPQYLQPSQFANCEHSIHHFDLYLSAYDRFDDFLCIVVYTCVVETVIKIMMYSGTFGIFHEKPLDILLVTQYLNITVFYVFTKVIMRCGCPVPSNTFFSNGQSSSKEGIY